MLDKVSNLSKNTFASASQPQGDLDAGSVESSFDDGEAIQYVLASKAGIEHATADRTTTIEPGDDEAAYTVVSNRRLYFFIGDVPTEPELTVALEGVTEVDLRDSLLSSTLVFSTPEGSVRFDPADGDTAKEISSYLSRVGGAWTDLFDALGDAEDAITAARSAIENGEDSQRTLQRARSHLSNAHHSATYEDDAPTEMMRAEIEPLEAELEQLRVEARLDRVDALVEDAREAREADEFSEAAGAVVEAADVLDDVTHVIEDGDPVDASDRRDSLAEAIETTATGLLTEAENACHRGLDAEDQTTAITAWEGALDRYRAAIAAEWDGPADVTLAALRYQLAWVVGNLIDSLAARASEREAEAEDVDDTVDQYEAAQDDLRRAHEMASEHPFATAGPLSARIETLEEKIERAEWQWGTAD